MKLTNIFLAGLVAISAITASAVAFAGPANDVEVTFYSDATMTTVVGGYELFCTGRHTSWGTTSGTYTREVVISCGEAGPGRPGGGN